MTFNRIAKISAAALAALLAFIFLNVKPLENAAVSAAAIEHPYASSIVEQSGELRESLSESNRQLYDVIKEGLLECESEILVRRFSYVEQDIQDVMWYIMQDSPEIFWVEWAWNIHSRSDGFIVSPSYIFTKEEVETKRAELEAAVNALAAEAEEKGMTSTELDKTRFVHDTLINSCSYTENSGDTVIHTSYGALVLGQAVCDGYAHAARLLLSRLGVQTRYVEGEAVNDGMVEGHAWNLVQVDGGYYHMDITWDDGDHKTDEGEATNVVSYTYFLVSDEEIGIDHSIQNKAELPDCGGYDYFGKMGLSAADFDDIADDVAGALFQNIIDGRYFVQFKIIDPAEFEAMSGEDIFQNGLTDVLDSVNEMLEDGDYTQRVEDSRCRTHRDEEHSTILIVFEEED
ncbi:MAG: transglutaminase domain-containing protein [Oscillospiraceae bacterium]|nr:transglutaminase domain-containing protein [Oscillospiraceae bacterium]